MIYEIREYPVRKGMRDEWLRLMEEMIIPFQRKMGMEIVGSFTNMDDPDMYVWIRRFESESMRKILYDRVYGHPYWKNEVREAMRDMLIKSSIRVMLLEPTEISFLR